MKINLIELNKAKVELDEIINERSIYIDASKIVSFEIIKSSNNHELTFLRLLGAKYCIVSQTPKQIIEMINEI